MSQNNLKRSGDSMVRLFGLNSAATYLGISYWTLRTMLHSGELPFVRAGRRILVDRVDLDAWIENTKQREEAF